MMTELVLATVAAAVGAFIGAATVNFCNSFSRPKGD